MARLGTLRDVPDDELWDLIDHTQELAELELRLDLENFRRLIDVAAVAAERSWRHYERRGDPELAQAHGEHKSKVRKVQADEEDRKGAREAVAMKGKAKRYR